MNRPPRKHKPHAEQNPVLIARWLLTRPQIIQDLAKLWPPAAQLNLHGTIHHVMGYYEAEGEDGKPVAGMWITPVDPGVNYHKAMRQRCKVCSCCLHKLEELRIP